MPLVEVFGLHMLTLDVPRNTAAGTPGAMEEILAWAGVSPRYRKLSAQRALRLSGPGIAANAAVDPGPPAVLRRDMRGGPDLPHAGVAAGAAVPRGDRELHHQRRDRAGPSAGGAAAGSRGRAVSARRGRSAG